MLPSFKDSKFSTQIWIGCLSLIVIFVSISIFNFFKIDEMSQIPLKMYKHPFTVSNAVRDIKINLSETQEILMRATLNLESSEREAVDLSSVIQEKEKIIETNFTIINERFLGNKDKIKQAEKYFTLLRGESKKVLTQIELGNYLAAQKLLSYSSTKYEAMIFKNISYLLGFADKKGVELNELAFTSKNNLMKKNIALIVMSCLLSIFIFNFVLRSVRRELTGAVDRLTDSFKSSKSCSLELKGVSQKLLDSTNSQSSSIESSSSSLDEISAMVGKNADSAKESILLSQKCQETCDEGKLSVVEMQRAIVSIKEDHDEIVTKFKTDENSLGDIAKIVLDIEKKSSIINDIVFQTKLLSFNASVEAARAGEHGKGFAVVAEEILSLSRMTGKAADEITGLVKSSSETVLEMIEESKIESEKIIVKSEQAVARGLKTSGECEDSLCRIIDHVKGLSEMISSISLASNEQSIGVKEISGAFSQLNHISHQTSTSAHVNLELSQSLAQNSSELSSIVALLQKIVNGSKPLIADDNISELPTSEKLAENQDIKKSA